MAQNLARRQFGILDVWAFSTERLCIVHTV
jgi:hypothetical protein